MKISETTSTLELSGIDKGEINYAYIECNSAILDILSNKIYKNKLGSLVREALSNAKDASVEERVNIPIKIHIPNMLNPYFAIQDYGVGMSKETIKNVFANFGKSSKTHSNELIGMYGLGAKTAGIYSKQYTVTSVHNKMKSVFQFFKDEKGMPVNVQLENSPTEEPNGTEIRIAVNESSDFKRFKEEISHYCRWIDYPIELSEELDIKKPEFDYEEESFALTKWPQKAPMLVSGGIPYSINFYDAQIANYYGVGVHGVKDNHIVIFSKIGDVDFIGSREEAEYTPKTIKFIQDAVAKIKAYYEQYILDKTQVWVIQNRKEWEYSQDKRLRHSDYIKVKQWNKWRSTKETLKVMSKYVLVDDINAKIAWGTACKKVKEQVDYVAFVNKKDKDDLLKIGIDPTTILNYTDLPKQKRGKLKPYKVMYLDSNNKLKTSRVDSIQKNHFYMNQFTIKRYLVKSLIEEILEEQGDKISIVWDDTKPEGLTRYLKDHHLKEKHSISYCNVVKALEKLGVIKTLTSYKDDGNDYKRKAFGLLKGETVDLSGELPLLSRVEWSTSNHCKPSKTEKEHALAYVNYVLSKNPNVISSKHLSLISVDGKGF